LIGNAAYQYTGKLLNPKNDVELLAASFRKSGFSTVMTRFDLTREQTIREFRDFAAVAEGADVAVVYYSGHGMQLGGINYLIPVDSKLDADTDVDLEAVDAPKALSAAARAKMLRILILDACRNNPFEARMRRMASTRALGRGMARMEADPGELIAFAARAGELAEDGRGSNSPYAEALARRIAQQPPVELRRLFDLVRDDVMASTARKQQPFTYGSLSGSVDFFFSR
jgi:uncharacterized caspase-like protein